MFFLGGWAVCVLPVIATTVGYRSMPLIVATGFVFLLALVISAALAIGGLVEIRKNPGRWNQGRKQATWTLALVGVIVCCMAYGAYRDRNDAGIQPSARITRPRGDSVVRNEELNFAFDLPGPPWVQVDAKKFNAEATLAVARARPSIFFMVIAEETGSKGVALDNDMLVEVVRINMGAAATAFEIIDQRPRTVNDLAGVHILARAIVNDVQLSYGFWVCARNGFAYQCITAGETTLEDQILRDNEELTRRFRLIAPDRSTLPEPPRPIEPTRRI
jgi:hypothetical protein